MFFSSDTKFFLLFIYSMTWDKSLHLMKWGLPSFPSFLLYEVDTRELYGERWPKLVLLKLLNRGLGVLLWFVVLRTDLAVTGIKNSSEVLAVRRVNSVVSAELVFGDKMFLTVLSGDNCRLESKTLQRYWRGIWDPFPYFIHEYLY